nr:ARM repeat superfamily protein [Tanacetum cinerariifolium]
MLAFESMKNCLRVFKLKVTEKLVNALENPILRINAARILRNLCIYSGSECFQNLRGVTTAAPTILKEIMTEENKLQEVMVDVSEETVSDFAGLKVVYFVARWLKIVMIMNPSGKFEMNKLLRRLTTIFNEKYTRKPTSKARSALYYSNVAPFQNLVEMSNNCRNRLETSRGRSMLDRTGCLEETDTMVRVLRTLVGMLSDFELHQETCAMFKHGSPFYVVNGRNTELEHEVPEEHLLLVPKAKELAWTERSQCLARAVSAEALPIEQLETHCPQNGMILANCSAIDMEPDVYLTPVSKKTIGHQLFCYSTLQDHRVSKRNRPLVKFYYQELEERETQTKEKNNGAGEKKKNSSNDNKGVMVVLTRTGKTRSTRSRDLHEQQRRSFGFSKKESGFSATVDLCELGFRWLERRLED